MFVTRLSLRTPVVRSFVRASAPLLPASHPTRSNEVLLNKSTRPSDRTTNVPRHTHTQHPSSPLFSPRPPHSVAKHNPAHSLDPVSTCTQRTPTASRVWGKDGRRNGTKAVKRTKVVGIYGRTKERNEGEGGVDTDERTRTNGRGRRNGTRFKWIRLLCTTLCNIHHNAYFIHTKNTEILASSLQNGRF